MLTTETRRKIDNCRDSLVGKIPVPSAQIEQITLALIYKFMSDIDKQNEELGGASFFEGDFDKYKWSNLMDKRLGAQERMNLYTEGLDSMGKNKYIPELFRNIFRNAYLPFKDPQTLDRFLKQIDEFNYDHSEELGNAFEYLLSTAGSQGDAGQFRTPRHIIDFIVSIVEPTKEDSILDPACGTAGFLISAYKYILGRNSKDKTGDLLSLQDKQNLTKNIVGYDISHEMVRLSLVNLYLHNFGDPKIYEYDTLSSEERRGDDFDCILANPPFMTPKGGIQPHSKFSSKTNKSEVLFVDYMMEHLKINGKAGIIVPEGIIFQSANAYKALRKKMVEDNYLWAVVSLPSGIFQPYSGVKTSILLFDKQLAKKTDKILFVKVDNDGYDLGAHRRQIGYEYNTEEVRIELDPLLKSITNKDYLIGKKHHDKIVYEINGQEREIALFVKNDLPIAWYILEVFKQMVGLGTEKEHFEKFLVDGNYRTKALSIEKSKIIEIGDYNLSMERYREIEAGLASNYEMVELGNSDLFELYQPQTITSKEILSEGPYKVFGANGIIGFYDKYNHEESEVLITCRGATCGTINFSEPKSWVTGNAMVVKPKTKEINKTYLFYILKYSDLSGTISGAAQPQITRQGLSPFKIPLPPLTIQESIVEELDRYQKIVDGAKQVVENWKPTIEINPEWEIVELGDVCDVRDGTHDSPKQVQVGYPLITSKNIKDGKLDFSNISYISEEDFKKVSQRSYVEVGDIIMPMIGTIGGACLIKSKETEFAIKNVALFKKSEKILPEFLLIILDSELVATEFRNQSAGATQKFVSLGVLRKLKVPLPPIEVQEKIIAKIKKERESIEVTDGVGQVFEYTIEKRIKRVWGEPEEF